MKNFSISTEPTYADTKSRNLSGKLNVLIQEVVLFLPFLLSISLSAPNDMLTNEGWTSFICFYSGCCRSSRRKVMHWFFIVHTHMSLQNISQQSKSQQIMNRRQHSGVMFVGGGSVGNRGDGSQVASQLKMKLWATTEQILLFVWFALVSLSETFLLAVLKYLIIW